MLSKGARNANTVSLGRARARAQHREERKMEDYMAKREKELNPDRSFLDKALNVGTQAGVSYLMSGGNPLAAAGGGAFALAGELGAFDNLSPNALQANNLYNAAISAYGRRKADKPTREWGPSPDPSFGGSKAGMALGTGAHTTPEGIKAGPPPTPAEILNWYGTEAGERYETMGPDPFVYEIGELDNWPDPGETGVSGGRMSDPIYRKGMQPSYDIDTWRNKPKMDRIMQRIARLREMGLL